MRIALSPQFSCVSLVLLKSGDVITVNGDDLDLSAVTEGADIPDDLARTLHPMIAGPIYREGGELHITLMLPLPHDCTDPWMCFPEPVLVTEDGPVDLPFATTIEMAEVAVVGGTNIVTTTRRWHQEDMVETVFVPEPVEAEEEEA